MREIVSIRGRSYCRGFVGLVSLLLIGCGQESDIRQYSVPKEQPRQVSLSSDTAGEQIWFFKLTGPKEEVLQYIAPFTGMIRTAEFTSGAPRYEVPEGWTISTGPPPRHETVAIPGTDPPLEVTISSLPAPGADFDGYLLANINRWRGQLDLPPLEGADWKQKAEEQSELISVPTGDRKITMVHLLGKTEDFGETRTLAAVISRIENGEAQAEMPRRPPVRTSQPLTYDIPQGWRESPGSSVRLASLKAEHESGVADIAVTRFPGGGDLLPNVNRWRSQVDLAPIEEAQLAETVEELTVSGKPATLVELIGDKETILAVTVEDGDAKWFFKMQGPVAAVEAEKDRFRQFIESVKIAE